jgi:HD domain
MSLIPSARTSPVTCSAADVRAATWGYRVRQLARAVNESRRPVSNSLLAAHLNHEGRLLFAEMTPRDQAHSAQTAMLVAERSPEDEDLITAALLHDAGKGDQSIWQRVLYVSLAAATPSLLACLARQGRGTRGALYRSLHHCRLGAELAARVGCSAETQRLIEGHHAAKAEGRLGLLQWADEAA